MNVFFTVIPYFTDIFWWEGYTDVNLAIDDIVIAFVKNGSINTIFWNYTLVSTKYKINTRHIYNVWVCQWFVYSLLMMWEKFFLDLLISNVVFPPIYTTRIKISSDNWTERKFIIYLARRISAFAQKISNSFRKDTEFFSGRYSFDRVSGKFSTFSKF